jgi:UDP-2,4-diacetamido-2,4,6-trideoxy-beta-L-altropyranose hydrolase
MPPLRVALRADASADIGIGHVKRSLALGQALRDAGAAVCLVTRENAVDTQPLADQARVDHVALSAHGKQVDWEKDAADTTAALAAWKPHLMVVDHYALDHRWHRAIKHSFGARLAAIDDLADRDLDADWLIDHNHSPDHHAKYAGRISPTTKLLCGPRHALLSAAYAIAPRHEVRDEVHSIGIFMGGADSAGMSGVAVEACRSVAGFTGRLEVATTSANPHLDKLRAACLRWPSTDLLVDQPDLSAFFERHDLQIGAGGGATWERCCIGAPTLALVCADNQRAAVPELVRLGVLETVDPTEMLSAEAIGQAVARLAQAPERRAVMAARARDLVDGLGARRVALCLCVSRLEVRAATAGDAERLYLWRNHPTTRAVSHGAHEIAWPGHLAWLTRTLNDSSRLLLVAQVGNIPVGVIRIDRQDATDALVSLYLDPALHGLGLGTAMLLAGERHACRQPAPPARFVATVLEANTASQHMFRSVGYQPHGEHWTKPAKPLPPSGEPTP